MTHGAQSDARAVADMLAAGEAIQRYARGGKAAFLGDDMVRSAVERQFEVMGTAASRLSDEFRQANPEVPWRTLIAFRDHLVDGGPRIEAGKVWIAVSESLRTTMPHLRQLVGE